MARMSWSMALLQNRVGSAARACYRRLAWGVTKGEATVTISADQKDFDSSAVLGLREDLALALRAAALHGFAEGVCNHFSVELPDGSGRFLLNPRGLLWKEVRGGDIVMVDGQGTKLAGVHEVEPTAMFIHAAIHRFCAKA